MRLEAEDGDEEDQPEQPEGAQAEEGLLALLMPFFWGVSLGAGGPFGADAGAGAVIALI